ncbi:glycosyltransferase [Candidatus Pelagibacter sp.]|nr:glycosyltransferase [Candidatus Pelagibacter sp.]
MRIGFVIENSRLSGGSYYQTLNFLNDVKKNFKGKHYISTYTNQKENLNTSSNSDYFFSHKFLDKVILKLSIFYFFRLLFNLLNFKTSFEKLLLDKKIDLIIFPAPSKLQFTILKIKFISTIFDLCHIEHKNFPEITEREFQFREMWINYIVKNTQAIITNSIILQKQISKRYNFPLNRIFTIPFNPIKKTYKQKKASKINFFLYPANYWKHKNHDIIIKATKLLIDKNIKNFKCIFTGGDKGYLKEIIKLVNSYKLNQYFEIKKFINDKDLVNLYINCSAVIMTSHFGPTNLPPLEAFTYKRPLIYNKKFEKEIPKKNCLMVNVSNQSDLSQAMLKILKNKYSKTMKLNAEKFLRLKRIQNIKNIKMLENFINNIR